MTGQLAGKVALVVGGARGIGAGVARRFAGAGARVMISDLLDDEGAALAEAIGGAYVRADIALPAGAQAAVAATMDRFGGFDILVQNAGIYPWTLIEDTSPEEWTRVLAVNLGGCFNAASAALPAMKAQGSGRMLFTSSITGPHVTSPGHGHYAASKAGINGFIRSAALEFAGYGITVNGVEPGNILTEGMQAHRSPAFIQTMADAVPLGRLGTPEDVANAFLFLASDDAAFITGTTIVVDGGQILPEGADFRIQTDMSTRTIDSYFDITPVDEAWLETPVPVVDLDIAEANIRGWQARCDRLGVRNRPHIKTHKLVGMAKFQLDVGAAGITVQKLGEAEAMADGGITDLLMTFNVVGAPKLARLAALAKRTAISVVADNPDVVAGLGTAGRDAGREISVLVECETGSARNGVQSPAEAAELARLIDGTEGVRYGGLMTYPAPGTRAASAAFLAEAQRLAGEFGLTTEFVSSGGTPEMGSDEGLEPVTEYRAGTYVYFDRSLIRFGTCALADCALMVRTTVVSVPTPDRAILDAGSKALTSDLIGLEDYGMVPALDDARVYKVNEEHGYLDIAHLERKPRVGDVVAVLPNHVCPVSNLFDRIALARGGKVLGLTRVDARGLVW